MSDSNRLDTLLRSGLLFVGGAFVGVFVVVALLRLFHPFELEWMEGAMVDHVARVSRGESLYVEPGIDYVPFIYPPGFYWASALVSAVTGPGFVPLRLVSILSALACLAFIGRIVLRATNERGLAFVAACLFVACYRRGDAWLDLGRVDTLFLALLLGGIDTLGRPATVANRIAAGVLLFLAFATKQTTLIIAGPVLVAALLSDSGRVRLLAPFWFLGLSAGFITLMNAASDGWFGYYVFVLPERHDWSTPMLTQFWTRDLSPVFLPLLALSVAGLVAAWRTSPRARFLPLLFAGFGLVGSSWLSRLHIGGHTNVLIPAFAFLSIAGTVGLADLLGSSRSKALRTGALLLVFVQFGLLAYNPFSVVPSRTDTETATRFEQRLRELPGDVLVPAHGYLAVRAGKSATAHQMAIFDVLRDSEDEVAVALRADIRQALASGRYGAVVLDFDWDFEDAVEAHYAPPVPALDAKLPFVPVSGVPTYPTRLYLAR